MSWLLDIVQHGDFVKAPKRALGWLGEGAGGLSFPNSLSLLGPYDTQSLGLDLLVGRGGSEWTEGMSGVTKHSWFSTYCSD